ncbi:hypothetical protein FB45DRAFT_789904 [Roridomyces roridus]|uniref:RRM domain-containing protein n=1 Tax=Roridomyces roridus TaxID=1738132 RepID=A0AAD7C0K0_9AGAR|nr:hypothetical protein FB45DRAFT_789904 [Roridomyces roridus]
MESEYQAPQGEDSFRPQPHPILHEPFLFVSNIPPNLDDEQIALAFASCGPFRPRINRDGSDNPLSGTIEFKFLDKAEKALATLQSRPIPGVQPAFPLVLSPYPPTTPPTPLPPPSALPRLVKHLPTDFNDSMLYDLFRPFGALALARAPTHFGADTGMVEFWNEDDARQAEAAMHCAEVQGQNIAVQVYQPRRTSMGRGSEFSPNAPTFVPGAIYYSPNASPPAHYSPPRGSPYHSPMQIPFVHGPGQQVQPAPLSGPGSTSQSGLIDPCNLFCKNLDPDIDSNGLFTHFRQFGQIVSARVMRNENGESRGFGFVSYQTPDQASAALHAMNGVLLGTKQVVVRLHEPKQLRQEKLAQRFGGHPRNSSGATSPTASEGGGESIAGWSPRHQHSSLGSPIQNHHDRPERGRRGSGSYYNAALQGTLNLPMRYDDLYALSPVVRQEVLTGELSRRVKGMDFVPNNEVDAIVENLVTISLVDVVQCIEDPIKLTEQVNAIRYSLRPSKENSPSKSPSPSASQDSRLLDPNALNATASAPEHPSTPISVSASLTTPPRTSSPSGSVPPTSERDRIFAAISKLESARQGELTDLLMSLPKRDRALCLFNVEVLRAKVADAKVVLESEEDDSSAAEAIQPVPVTPQAKKIAASTSQVASPQTPDLSSRGPSATASPAPTTPGNSTHTIASLARLPAAEIIRLANSASATGLPLPKADPLVVQATDEFIDGLLDKAPQVQKQQLGDKLFKTVKSFGIKAAPKVTIALLDQEDLRALAHLMNSYSSVLKEKAQGMIPAK